MMDEIGVAPNERKKIFTDGFESCEELVNHFIDDVDGFKKYLEIVNKTSTNANTNLHFTPPAMRRFVGVVYYLNTVVNGMHNISDVLQITKEMSEMYGEQYKSFGKEDNSDDDTEDLTIPKLTDAASWVPFRDAFMSKLNTITGSRGFTLDYVIDTTDRAATHVNDAKDEVDDVDLEMDHVFSTRVTHFGRGFKKDNKTVWSRLRNLLLNTNPYTHISSYHTSSDGRAAWIALKSIYEGKILSSETKRKHSLSCLKPSTKAKLPVSLSKNMYLFTNKRISF